MGNNQSNTGNFEVECERTNDEKYEDPIGIIIVGVTRNGKSATGNTILGRDEFLSRGERDPVIKKGFVGYRRWSEGLILKVVDNPGFKDTTETNPKKCASLLTKSITKSLGKYPHGFNAILFVVSYGQWVDENVINGIERLINLFGEECFQDHGVLVVTHSDAFKRDFGDDTDIKTYIRNQESKTYHRLLKLCGGRCVLFDNVTDDNAIKDLQIESLLQEIHKIRPKPYLPKICIPKHMKSKAELEARPIEIETIDFAVGMLKADVYDLKNDISNNDSYQNKLDELRNTATRVKQQFPNQSEITKKLSKFRKICKTVNNLKIENADKLIKLIIQIQNIIDEEDEKEKKIIGSWLNCVADNVWTVLTSKVKFRTRFCGGFLAISALVGLVSIPIAWALYSPRDLWAVGTYIIL